MRRPPRLRISFNRWLLARSASVSRHTPGSYRKLTVGTRAPVRRMFAVDRWSGLVPITLFPAPLLGPITSCFRVSSELDVPNFAAMS